MKYKFQSTLHRNSREMHQHIAESYMTAGGANDEETVRRFFNELTDEQLANDAIINWGLSDLPNFDRAELVSALRIH